MQRFAITQPFFPRSYYRTVVLYLQWTCFSWSIVMETQDCGHHFTWVACKVLQTCYKLISSTSILEMIDYCKTIIRSYSCSFKYYLLLLIKGSK